MKKPLLAIAFALAVMSLLFISCRGRPPAEEGKCKLKAKKVGKPEMHPVWLACQYLTAKTEKPPCLKDLPKSAAGDPTCYVAKLGAKETPFVLTVGKKRSRQLLYVDTDGDGLLSDERPIKGKPIRESLFGPVDYYRFGPVRAAAADPNRRATFYAAGGKGGMLSLYPARCMVGTVRLRARTYKVAVMDGDLDGRYDKLFSPPTEQFWWPGCDTFAIDLDGNGIFESAFYERMEIMPLGRLAVINNRYYAVKLSPAGTFLELEEAQPQCGTLNLGKTQAKLMLWSDAASQWATGSMESTRLPAGRYSANFIELLLADSEGNNWTFRSRQKTGPLSDFKISADKETFIEIGPPFLIKTDVTQNNRDVSIGVELVGRSGEHYVAGAMKNDKRQPPPALKIVDEKGDMLETGKFRYG